MAKVKVSLYIEEDTSRKIDELAAMTFRGKGDTVDWLVAEAWERAQAGQLQAGKSLADLFAPDQKEEGRP